MRPCATQQRLDGERRPEQCRSRADATAAAQAFERVHGEEHAAAGGDVRRCGRDLGHPIARPAASAAANTA
jgi:hypothetical protein